MEYLRTIRLSARPVSRRTKARNQALKGRVIVIGGVLLLTAAIASKVTLYLQDQAVAGLIEAARVEAYEQAKTEALPLMLKDQATVNKLCYSWWFNMDHKERKLDRKNIRP